jgi:hypothetical protein
MNNLGNPAFSQPIADALLNQKFFNGMIESVDESNDHTTKKKTRTMGRRKKKTPLLIFI